MTVGLIFVFICIFIIIFLNIYRPQICIGSTCNHFCLFNICYRNKNVYVYVILCRLNTSSGGSKSGGGLPKKCS